MPEFNVEKDIPDLSGKVIFVTGGNSGLGLETVAQLSKHNAKHIYLAARSKAKAEAAIEQVKQATPQACPISFIELDLGSLKSVQRAAEEFRAQSSELHLLINNAGIMGCPADVTADGYEIQFGTNHMGHALLTKLLLPTLETTALTGQDVRVVNVSSDAEAWAPANLWDFNALKTDMASLTTFKRYGVSKVANIHHARALSRRHQSVRFASVHPGLVATDLGRGITSSFPLLSRLMIFVLSWMVTTPTTGVRNQLWASFSDMVESGEFYYPVGIAGKGSPQSQDKKIEDALWSWTEKELETFC